MVEHVMLLLLFNVCMQNAADWNRVTSPAIPNPATDCRVIGYDANSNLIWLLGGEYTKNQNQLISFNKSSNSYVDYGSHLAVSIYYHGQNYVQKENILYIAMNSVLYKYILSDIVSDVITVSNIDFTSNAQDGCLSYVDNYLLYTIGTTLHIYNITSNTWINEPNTPTMITSRYYHSCQVSKHKYLYIFGGTDSDTVHKINVSDISHIKDQTWIPLINTLSSTKEWTSSVIFNNMIYYIGGSKGGDPYYDTVDVINTINDSIHTLDASLYHGIDGISSIVISNRIYAFGGYDSSHNSVTYYQYIDIHTAAPTSSPSKIPTNFPTNFPTTIPSNIPTNIPKSFTTDFPTSYIINQTTGNGANEITVVASVLCVILCVCIIIYYAKYRKKLKNLEKLNELNDDHYVELIDLHRRTNEGDVETTMFDATVSLKSVHDNEGDENDATNEGDVEVITAGYVNEKNNKDSEVNENENENENEKNNKDSEVNENMLQEKNTAGSFAQILNDNVMGVDLIMDDIVHDMDTNT